MHILFLTQVLPYPLDAGPKVRAYHVLRYLAQRHRITLVSFVRPTDSPDALAHLGELCDSVHTVIMPRSTLRDAKHLLRSIVTGRPFIIARDVVPEMHRTLQEVLASVGPVDAIHADQLWMAPYALSAKQWAHNGQAPLTVLDQHNAVYMIPRRLLSAESNPVKRAILQLETWKLARFEVKICHQFDHVVWLTDDDYAAVQQQTPGATDPLPNSGVIPICIDPISSLPVQRKSDSRRVTFVGGLHYPPNAEGITWFAQEVFGKVLSRVPEAVLTVIGKQPPGQLQQPDLPTASLDITGYVDDLQPYLQETAVFIVPLWAGGGMRVKILDAWTWGLPIVSTTVGAEGIEICNGENILIADTPDRFADAVNRLLEEPNLQERLRRNGRLWVETRYDWRHRYALWDHIYPN